jgi:DNA-binding NtrC family response regulator
MNENWQSTALVVDDEPDLAWALQQVLKLDGWQAIVAYTGKAALELASTRRLRIVFVDAKLPDMDGMVVAERIGKLQPGAAIVLISGYFAPDDHEIEEAQQRGLFIRFISKPFDLQEISDLADAVLERKA